MKKIITLILTLIIVFHCAGCSPLEREYCPDLFIPLQDESDRLIIKEWTFLHGSGADVYYQDDDQNPVLLGKTTGSDDGFCPFKKGMYEITQEGDSITIKWCFNPSDNDKNNWRGEVFDLSSLEKN